jgi:hypothetical protein
MRDGAHNAPSNAAFDASLKAQNPSWGLRDIADLEREAKSSGLNLRETIEMPANNTSLVFVKTVDGLDVPGLPVSRGFPNRHFAKSPGQRR